MLKFIFSFLLMVHPLWASSQSIEPLEFQQKIVTPEMTRLTFLADQQKKNIRHITTSSIGALLTGMVALFFGSYTVSTIISLSSQRDMEDTLWGIASGIGTIIAGIFFIKNQKHINSLLKQRKKLKKAIKIQKKVEQLTEIIKTNYPGMFNNFSIEIEV